MHEHVEQDTFMVGSTRYTLTLIAPGTIQVNNHAKDHTHFRVDLTGCFGDSMLPRRVIGRFEDEAHARAALADEKARLLKVSDS